MNELQFNESCKKKQPIIGTFIHFHHITATIWYYLNISLYRLLLSGTILTCLPERVTLAASMHLFKTLKW